MDIAPDLRLLATNGADKFIIGASSVSTRRDHSAPGTHRRRHRPDSNVITVLPDQRPNNGHLRASATPYLSDIRHGYSWDGARLGIAPTVTHSTDLGFVTVIISDAVGGRDTAAMARAYEDFEFQGHAMVTDSATIIPLLAREQS